jgi:uncharacterized membrane protein
MGVTIRHYFNSVHARKGKPMWTWGLTAALFAAIMWLSTMPKTISEEEDTSALPAAAQRFAAAPQFEAVNDVVLGRCSMCHTAEPGWEGIHWPPNGVVLDSEHQIAKHAREIFLQAGASHAMPPANVSFMETAERALIVEWYNAGVSGVKSN